MYKIKAVAPTTYQYTSLGWFNMPIRAVGNGSFISERLCDSEEEAKEYLTYIARNYYEFNEYKLEDALENIAAAGILQIDAVVARIEKVF
jgi:hypothetical protein